MYLIENSSVLVTFYFILAITPAKVYSLSREVFEQIMNFTVNTTTEVRVHREMRPKLSKPVPQIRASAARIMPEFSHIELNDLKRLGCLGKGGFGRVELVQYKDHEVFALKYLKKYDIVQCQQQKHVFNEKEVMFSCDSPFIVKYV